MTPPTILLITAHLEGRINDLPRVYTALQRLRRAVAEKCLLIDTGLAWSEDAWACQATENRAPYIVLDAMGYHMAFADGLNEESRAKLAAQVQVNLVAGDTAEIEGIQLARDAQIQAPYLESGRLMLPLPPRYTILAVHYADGEILAVESHNIGADALPDATIAGTVEFVESEARYYAKKIST